MIATPGKLAFEVQPAPMVRDYLSFSAINAYRTCPLKYMFRYIAGLPEETVAASLVLGAAVHRAVEHHFRELLAGNPPPDLDSLLEQFDLEWQERDHEHVRFGKGED